MTTLFATNKTFTMTGTTSDTMEPYVSTIGYEIVLRKNAFGGGSHYAPAMVVLHTVYTDEINIDRVEQRVAKAEAKAEAIARAAKINAIYAERAAA